MQGAMRELFCASEIRISGKPSMAEILCLHIFLSFFFKKNDRRFWKAGWETWWNMEWWRFFFPQKKSPRVGFFTTPILVGGPTQATTAARQQFKVDKIKGINDMKCHAMLWNSYVSYDAFAIVLDCIAFLFPYFFSHIWHPNHNKRRGFGVLLYVLLWSEVQYVISKWDLARRKQLQYAAHPQDNCSWECVAA